ncbi:MAG: acyl-CoA thioesterase [Schwartzia sp.]|nr:acyl-CoA thioesterase [Schwartzia sp. (in: firmicutes)]
MISRTVYRVKFFDTDAMAVIHHSNYIRLFEIGRVELLRKAGITLDEIMADGFVFPITEVRAKFHNPGKFDDELVIETKPAALTKAKMAFDYRIARKDDDLLIVTGHTQNVFTKIETGHIARLPEKYYDRFRAAMEN